MNRRRSPKIKLWKTRKKKRKKKKERKYVNRKKKRKEIKTESENTVHSVKYTFVCLI